jgi:hypothetical protein
MPRTRRQDALHGKAANRFCMSRQIAVSRWGSATRLPNSRAIQPAIAMLGVTMYCLLRLLQAASYIVAGIVKIGKLPRLQLVGLSGSRFHSRGYFFTALIASSNQLLRWIFCFAGTIGQSCLPASDLQVID